MTIDTDGFLSADISTWVEKHRKENREWFELASDLNRVAHQQLALLKIPSEDSKAFTAALPLHTWPLELSGSNPDCRKRHDSRDRHVGPQLFRNRLLFGRSVQKPGIY